MTADAATVEVERRDRVAVVAFNRPDQLNAMNGAMQRTLIETLEALGGDPDIDAIVLTGRGTSFMAGADIKEYAAYTPPAFRAFQLQGRRLYDAIERGPKPVIAAVDGYALGGGFEIVLACDLVVASPAARMGLPEVRLGLVPGGGGTQRLARKIGPNRAFEMVATGQQITAEGARTLGLVNRVVDGDLIDAAVAFAHEILRTSPEAVFALKRLVRLAREAELATGLDAEVSELERLYRGEVGARRVREFAARSEKKAD